MFSKLKRWFLTTHPLHWGIGSVIFTLIILGVVQTTQIRKLETAIVNLSTTLDDQQEKLATYATDTINTEHELQILKGDVQIMDSVLNADKKRIARIVKVRDTIRNELRTMKLPVSESLTPDQVAGIATAIVDYSDKYDLQVPLLMGLFRQESAFDPKAVSAVGAEGIGQMMPNTARDVMERKGKHYYNAFNAYNNIEASATYMSELMREFDYNVQHAVWAYNAGPTAVHHFLAGAKDYLPHETVDHEQQVTAFTKKFEAVGVN